MASAILAIGQHTVRTSYQFTHMLSAVAAWDRHQRDYLTQLTATHAPHPTPETLENYRSVFLEGYCEALADTAIDGGQNRAPP
jgi:hypothetical protein